MIPHLPIALDAGFSSFRQRGAFVKEKSAGRPRVSEESVEQVILFFAVRRKETFIGMYNKLVELLFHFY